MRVTTSGIVTSLVILGLTTSAYALSGGEFACQSTVGAQSRKFAAARHEAIVRCDEGLVRGIGCDPGRRDDRIGRAEDALSRQIERRCAGIDLRQLGFPGGCANPGGAGFTTSELSACVSAQAVTSTDAAHAVEYPALMARAGQEARCQVRIGRAGQRLVEQELRARTRCRDRQLRGVVASTVDCAATVPPGTGYVPTDRAIAQATAYVKDQLRRACGSVALANLGFPGACPDATGGAFTLDDLTSCVLATHAAAVDGLVAIAYASAPPVPTATRTATPLPTGTPTATPTASATATATATLTAVPTLTATPTPSASATVTATATVTPTFTALPTLTATPTVTVTATATLTATPTVTVTATAEPGATPTATPTATLTATPTVTATLTSTPTLTATLTPTPTVTATVTPIASATTTATRTATPSPTATPTATSTPSGPVCGNGVIEEGEDCDPPGSQCPNTAPGFFCSATCQCACPATVTFAGDAYDPLSLLDVGWTGIAHKSGIISDGVITAAVTGCEGSSRPCGVCTLGGPVENAGSNVLKSRRCTNNTQIQCTSDTPCTAAANKCLGGSNAGAACTVASQCPSSSCAPAGTCQFFFGSNLPLSSGGVATCTANEVAGSLTGTANIETGESASVLNLTSHVFTGITTDQPCPQCNGDGTPNDGVAGGTCAGGDRDGLACDVNGVSPNVSFGSTSLDCPPTGGANIANLAIRLGNSTGQEKKTLTTANPNCRALGYTTNKCFCDTCNNAAATPCSSNADCVAVGATVCGGKRCLSGANAGAACTTTSQCPGGSCTIPGQPTAPNACLPPDGAPDGCQPVGDNRGRCADGPTDNNCAPPEQHRGCIGPSDCPVTGTCVPALRECFLDMGVVAGNGDCAGGSNEGASCSIDSECPGGICQQRGELIAQGVADPPVNDQSTPTVAAVFCIGPTGASAVNGVAGLPGPARLTLRGIAKGLP